MNYQPSIFELEFNNAINDSNKLSEENDVKHRTTPSTTKRKITERTIRQNNEIEGSGLLWESDISKVGGEFTGNVEKTIINQNGISRYQNIEHSDTSTGNREGSIIGRTGVVNNNVSRRDIKDEGNKYRVNYRISGLLDTLIEEGGAKTKCKNNFEALRVLKKLREENRLLNANKAEQDELVKYVGWGGIPQVFDVKNPEWQKEYRELLDLLSSEEYDAARFSTQDAHYTSNLIIRSIYQSISEMGFSGGHILEPSLGSGKFIGLMPNEIIDNSKIYGIELDRVTADLARSLYPNIEIENKGYQDINVKDGTFDLVVGNPPFGNRKVADNKFPFSKQVTIHNYFIAKSIEGLRDNGLLAMVVSHHFMDANNSTTREFIADRAHFLGAIRLPNNTFKKNALTEVTTDIVFFQKAGKDIKPDRTWVDTSYTEDKKRNSVFEINRYFKENPNMMLGDMNLNGSMYADNTPTLEAIEGKILEEQLLEAIKNLPKNIYQTPKISFDNEDLPRIDIPKSVKVNSYFIDKSGQICKRLEDDLSKKNYEIVEVSDKDKSKIIEFISLRKALRDLMQKEKTEKNPETLELINLRDELNQRYDSFIKRHGHINSQGSKNLFKEDPEYPILCSLEKNYDRGITKETASRHGVNARKPRAEKADIFYKRIMRPISKVTHCENAKDALAVCMNDIGRVDFNRLVRLTRKSANELEDELYGLIYLNPETNIWETRDQYLGGNVKKKLKIAIEANTNESKYLSNVEALRSVQPVDLEPEEISVNFGSTWIPPEVIKDFVIELLGKEIYTNINYQSTIGKWICKIRNVDDTTNHVTWGTYRMGANGIIEHILGNHHIQVRDRIGVENGKPIYKVNENETTAAQQKADEIKNKFHDWIWDDEKRRVKLAKIYNERFNTNIPTKYDGSHLHLEGIADIVELRPHQKNAIWRGIQEGTALFDHEVGAGKTFVCIATAMESRRMGLTKKTMFVVPNHLLMQWRDSFYTLYPEANVLIAGKDDFKKENRQKLFARIATGEWDGIIVAHSSFKRVAMPEDEFIEFLQEQVIDLTNAIIQQKENNGDRVTIKEMEKARARMEERIKNKMNTGKKDDTIDFSDLGIDALFIDESQEFKNLFFSTSLNRVAGLGNREGSEKAMDMFIKVRSIQKKNNGRGVYFATGTPISNTIAEVYTVQRYMQYDELKQRGIQHFDSWASTFGNISNSWELDATGINYRQNSRFSKFQNIPELVSMYRDFADVITKQDLIQQALDNNKKYPIPKIKGNKPKNCVVERSDQQAKYQGIQIEKLDDKGNPVFNEEGLPIRIWNEGSIVHRMENLPKDPSIDNPLKITNDARLAALDFRIINSSANDFKGSKVNKCVENVFAIWNKWSEQRGTQLIFCDLSTPKGAHKNYRAENLNNKSDDSNKQEKEIGEFSMDEILSLRGDSKFSVYDDIKIKLISSGIPENEIKFIHDTKNDLQKQKLFEMVNRGDVRILIGTTAKMGAGMNVQKRLVAMHDLDCPWRPSDIEQRMGRILRQGNMFYELDPIGFEVDIIRYSTVRTYDARMWQTIETKAKSIDQFRKGDQSIRVIDDITSQAANAAEMKAEATGNPLILVQVQLRSELKRYEALNNNHRRNHYALKEKIKVLEGVDNRTDEQNALLKSEIEIAEPKKEDWIFVTENYTYSKDNIDKFGDYIESKIKSSIRNYVGTSRDDEIVGKYRGFNILMNIDKKGILEEIRGIQYKIIGNGVHRPNNLFYESKDKFSSLGFIHRLDNVIEGFQQQIEKNEIIRVEKNKELLQAKEEVIKDFEHKDKLELIRKDLYEVVQELNKSQGQVNYKTNWRPKSGDYRETFEMAGAEIDFDDVKEDSKQVNLSLSENVKKIVNQCREAGRSENFIYQVIEKASDIENKINNQRDKNEISNSDVFISKKFVNMNKDNNEVIRR